MNEVDTLEAVRCSQAVVSNLLSDAIESLRACRRSSYAYDRRALRDELTDVIAAVRRIQASVVGEEQTESEVSHER